MEIAEQEYDPRSDGYRFRTGQRKGRGAAPMMFTMYGWLEKRLREMDRLVVVKPNEWHLYLRWMIRRGEEVVTSKLCPLCNERRVTFFSARGDRFGWSFEEAYTSCNHCLERLRMSADAKCTIRPLKFSSIPRVSPYKVDQRQAGEFFRRVFLPGVQILTSEIAHQFFVDGKAPA